MKKKTCYCMILMVYVGLWGCQVFVCQSTHSLIVLTDSYINLYQILEVSLEILCLQVQSKIKHHDKTSLNPKLFGRYCTYQLKRLPLLGSFINTLFLGALLMSAAIEGIQSCFHAHHLIYDGGRSILLENKLTYPALLVGFSILGIIMRCSLDTVSNLNESSESIITDNSKISPKKSIRNFTVSGDDKSNDVIREQPRLIVKDKKYLAATMDIQDSSTVSLKSLRIDSELGQQLDTMQETGYAKISTVENERQSGISAIYHYIRYLISPLAMMICAVIVYFVTNDLATEISDALLAIMIVSLMFITSYPSMKLSGRVLLQSVPGDLAVDILESELKSISPLIVAIDDLHVWTLEFDTGRVGTCKLRLDSKRISDCKEVSQIISDARKKFASKGITCASVQPLIVGAS